MPLEALLPLPWHSARAECRSTEPTPWTVLTTAQLAWAQSAQNPPAQAPLGHLAPLEQREVLAQWELLERSEPLARLAMPA